MGPSNRPTLLLAALLTRLEIGRRAGILLMSSRIILKLPLVPPSPWLTTLGVW